MSSLLNSSAKSARFPTVGTRVGGRVVKDAQEIQQRDFDSGELLFWDDGKPRMQLVVTVATDEADPADPDDDGERAIYVKSQMLQATRQACRRAKKFAIEEGDFLLRNPDRRGAAAQGQEGQPEEDLRGRVHAGRGRIRAAGRRPGR